MVGRTVEAIGSRVETNSFLSAGSSHGLASSEEVIRVEFRASGLMEFPILCPMQPPASATPG